jgi:hypothetical protein
MRALAYANKMLIWTYDTNPSEWCIEVDVYLPEHGQGLYNVQVVSRDVPVSATALNDMIRAAVKAAADPVLPIPINVEEIVILGGAS